MYVLRYLSLIYLCLFFGTHKRTARVSGLISRDLCILFDQYRGRNADDPVEDQRDADQPRDKIRQRVRVAHDDHAEDDGDNDDSGRFLLDVFSGGPDDFSELSFQAVEPFFCCRSFFFCHDPNSFADLLCFLMHRVLFAETAILLGFHTIGMSFLILLRVVVALFTFRAS